MEPSFNTVPLWQSLIGSIGAFGVAAFTVWLTHRHTQQREADKDRRANNVAKAADLKERLNAMMDDVAEAFFQATGSHNATFAVAAQGAAALPPPSFGIPTGDPVSIVVRVVSRLGPYAEKFKSTSLPMIATRQAVVDEARRLIVNDFDLEP